MVLQGLRPSLSTSASGCVKSFDSAVMLMGRAINEGRRLISELRPMIIDEMGIVDALEYLIAEEEARGEMQIRFTHRIQRERLPALLQANVFRIVREALNNALKHSSARNVVVRLSRDESIVTLEVSDDGVGFVLDQPGEGKIDAGGLGLNHIRERAKGLNAALEITTAPEQGTTVRVTLPAPQPSAAGSWRGTEGSIHYDWTSHREPAGGEH